jgi:hypothetical protein
VAGALVLTRFTRIGAYVVGAWLLAIAFNLIAMGTYLDIAVRDVVMSIGAFTLAEMSAVRIESTARDAAGERAHVPRPHHAPA